MKKATLLVLTLIVLGCGEDYYPPGLYGYQVERLLHGGDEKVWFAEQYVVDGEIMPKETCEDSVWLYFKRVGTETKVDSLVCYEIRPGENCGIYDSIYYGAFHGSGQKGLFRDSLIFRGGEVDYAMVDYIDSDDLSLTYSLFGANVFVKCKADGLLDGITSKQIEAFLAGSTSQGTGKTFEATRLSIDKKVQEFTSCQDSIRTFFKRENNLVKAYELAPQENCEDFDTVFYGNMQVSNKEGLFTDTLFFTGGELDTVVFELTGNTSFSMAYARQDTLQYQVNYRLVE